MPVYRKRFGTPEDMVPTRFAPAPKCSIEEGLPEHAPEMTLKRTHRGTQITFPVDSAAGIYGFGLQLKRAGAVLHTAGQVQPLVIQHNLALFHARNIQNIVYQSQQLTAGIGNLL